MFVEFLQVLLAFTKVSLDLHFSYHGKTVQKVGFGFYTSLQLVSLFSKKQSFVVFYVDQLGAINKKLLPCLKLILSVNKDPPTSMFLITKSEPHHVL